MHYFATLFDQHYLSRGLCLQASLNRVMPNKFKLFILALDQKVTTYFCDNHSPNIVVITLREIEEFYPDLAVAKNNRSLIEYYFTLSPILPLYILENFKFCDRITTLDADIYFYSSPFEIFEKYNRDAILITPHDFSSDLAHLSIYGLYNVSFQSFPQTDNGLSLLRDWKEKCLAWCKDKFEPTTGYFADQKYLDDWQENFENVHSINMANCGRAPWNISNLKLTIKNKTIYVNNQPLIYYHFHGLRINGSNVRHGLDLYKVSHLSAAIKKIYSKYILNLYAQNKIIRNLEDHGVVRDQSKPKSSTLFDFLRKYEIGAIIIFPKKVIFYNLSRLRSKLGVIYFLKIFSIGRVIKP